MNWSDVGKAAEKILPYAVTAFGGPAGPALGGILSAALGTTNTPDAVQSAITTDPAAADKILAYDVQLKTIVANQVVAEHAADVDNTKDARRLAIAKSYAPQICLSLFFIGGYFAILGLLMDGAIHVPADYHDVFENSLGAMLTAVTLILNFWFGSTHGSQKKDDVLTQAAVQ